jgi:hypothetical protein
MQYYILKLIPAHMPGNIYIKHVHMVDVGKCSIKFKLQGGTQMCVA